MKKHLMTAAAAAGLLVTAFGASASAQGNTYTVHSGDSLWEIAHTQNVTINQLKQWNHLSSDRIYVNQKLSISAPSKQTVTKLSTESVSTAYTVKPGDCLSAIAKKYGTTITRLKTLNGLQSDVIRIGQKLKISGSAPAVAASVSTYRIQKGDTLSEIAARFHTTVTNLTTINHLTSSKILVGQVIKVKGSAPKISAKTVVKASLDSMGTAIADEAQKYIGVRYTWGGNTPASGFDCSGFVKYVFNHLGVSLPRTSAQQWNATTRVGSPKIGDLIFFETYKIGPSHVGIYLGNNKFISAASAGVKISDLTSTYWKTRYLGAKTAL